MPKNPMVERTAKEPFTLNDKPVAKGQIVTLTPTQKTNLVASGCVADTDEENELVPKGELPPLQQAPGQIESEEIAKTVDEARRSAVEEMRTLRSNIEDARKGADAEIASQKKRVAEAKAAADAEVASHQKRAADAKAEADKSVEAAKASAGKDAGKSA